MGGMRVVRFKRAPVLARPVGIADKGLVDALVELPLTSTGIVRQRGPLGVLIWLIWLRFRQSRRVNCMST